MTGMMHENRRTFIMTTDFLLMAIPMFSCLVLATRPRQMPAKALAAVRKPDQTAANGSRPRE